MRLASLTCSNTEILAALGLLEDLVAVDGHSDVPGLERAVRLGPDLAIQTGLLAASRPDLVLASLSVPGMERVVQQVGRLGFDQLTLDPVRLSDVWGDVLEVGAVLGRFQLAAQLVAAWRAELSELAGEVLGALAGWRPRVAVEWWPRPVIVAGGKSWVSDLVSGLGAQLVPDAPHRRSLPLTPSDLGEAAPDLLVLSWCGVKRTRPEVVGRRGIALKRVAVIPESALGRPGPRLLEGARALAAELRVLAALA